MLKVSRQPSGEPEIFYSLQGEGPSIGTPTVFLRLATCNLACTWCDTKYTWDWENYDYKQEVIPLHPEVVERHIVAFGCPHLVITGGEPMMQQKSLAPMVTSLKERGLYCEVETNGTVVPQPEMVEAVSQWNVSPKLGNSENRLERREVARALEAFGNLSNTYFKFVVVGPADVDEVCGVVERYGLPAQRVILMPEGTTVEAISSKANWVANACAKQGFRFSTRLHILLWGDERGK